MSDIIHGDWVPRSERVSWNAMKARCYSMKHPKYHQYGGRGIEVCERWLTFENFLADMGPKPTSRHTIERRDSNGNYEPFNCYWATYAEQMRNVTRNVNITIDGVTKCVTDWASESGVDRSTVYNRLNVLKQDARTAIFTPAHRHRFITHNGETLCLRDWAKRAGIQSGTLRVRLQLGWDFQRAISTPSRQDKERRLHG